MFFVYDLIYLVLAVCYIPYLVVFRKWHSGFWARAGRISPETLEALESQNNIWIHAVSVGEVVSVVRLIEGLQNKYPMHQIVLSTVTQTGYALAAKRLRNNVLVMYAPLDFSLSVKQYIRAINPKIYIAAETEIWPNLITFLHKRGVPVVQVNGRVSDRSFRWYRKFKFLLRGILDGVDAFCMQSQADAQKITGMGAPQGKTQVIGHMKFDDVPDGSADISVADLGLDGNQMVWVAGSTHPGEERIVLNVFKKLSEDFENLRLVIVPRHVERSDEIERIIREFGYQPVRFSRLRDKKPSAQSVILVDTIGHLKSFYSIAGIVFVGKSLTAQGGQNIIEPAFFGKAVLTGPHMENFKDITEQFLKEKAIVQVANEENLLSSMVYLLKNPKEREDTGNRAREVVRKNTGATEKSLKVISELIAVQ